MTSPGRDLAERFHAEVVRPLLVQAAPEVPYAAGLLGVGSEVLGFDDERSTDHDFGCRLTVLVDDEHAGRVPELYAAMEAGLPASFDGFPVRYPRTRDPVARHRVVVTTVHGFAQRVLGVDPVAPSAVDWLSLTGQSVLEVVGGPIFHDATKANGAVRQRLERYPDDVWRYVVASGWRQIAGALPRAGRTAERGDELGSRAIAALVAGRLRHLAFVLHGTWMPYDKWAGTVLRTLPDGVALSGLLEAATAATSWPARATALVAAVDAVAEVQRLVGLPAVSPATVPFFDRPFPTVDLRLAEDVEAQIADPVVRRLPPGVGAIEQWCDNVELLTAPERRVVLGRAALAT